MDKQIEAEQEKVAATASDGNTAKNDKARILHLMMVAQRPLSINELLVGLYRKYSLQRKRSTVKTILSRLKRDGIATNPTGTVTYYGPQR